MLPDRARSGGVGRAKRPPPFGFWKGAALGFAAVIPAVSATVWGLARLGIGNAGITFMDSLRMTTVFAGTAGVLTAGGIGRLAAHASLLPGGHRTATWRATRAQAVAGAGLTLIASIPHGYLPANPLHWVWIGLAGIAVGAVCGALIGVICGAPAAERLPELLRRVPVLADWARAVSRDPRVRAAAGPAPAGASAGASGDARRSGRHALMTETARRAAPPAKSGSLRSSRAERVERAVTDPGATPLPAPVPLGEETPLPKAEPAAGAEPVAAAEPDAAAEPAAAAEPPAVTDSAAAVPVHVPDPGSPEPSAEYDSVSVEKPDV